MKVAIYRERFSLMVFNGFCKVSKQNILVDILEKEFREQTKFSEYLEIATKERGYYWNIAVSDSR